MELNELLGMNGVDLLIIPLRDFGIYWHPTYGVRMP
jgi:hypothetical protein